MKPQVAEKIGKNEPKACKEAGASEVGSQSLMSGLQMQQSSASRGYK